LMVEDSWDVTVHDSKNHDFKYVTGIFSTAGVMVANGRIYPQQILERECNMFIESKVKNRCAWGELGHPDGPDINLDRIAIIVTDLEWKSNNLFGKAEIIDESAPGHQAKALLNHGRIGISSRGLGTVNDATKEVNSDYKLVTWDLVSTPSNSNSWVNGILESKSFYITEETEVDDKKTTLENILEKFNTDLWHALEYTIKNNLNDERKIISGMISEKIKNN